MTSVITGANRARRGRAGIASSRAQRKHTVRRDRIYAHGEWVDGHSQFLTPSALGEIAREEEEERLHLDVERLCIRMVSRGYRSMT